MKYTNKDSRKINKRQNIEIRKINKYYTDVGSIVIDGLPLVHWYNKFNNKEIDIEDYYAYFYLATDKLNK